MLPSGQLTGQRRKSSRKGLLKTGLVVSTPCPNRRGTGILMGKPEGFEIFKSGDVELMLSDVNELLSELEIDRSSKHSFSEFLRDDEAIDIF